MAREVSAAVSLIINRAIRHFHEGKNDDLAPQKLAILKLSRFAKLLRLAFIGFSLLALVNMYDESVHTDTSTEFAYGKRECSNDDRDPPKVKRH